MVVAQTCIFSQLIILTGNTFCNVSIVSSFTRNSWEFSIRVTTYLRVKVTPHPIETRATMLHVPIRFQGCMLLISPSSCAPGDLQEWWQGYPWLRPGAADQYRRRRSIQLWHWRACICIGETHAWAASCAHSLGANNISARRPPSIHDHPPSNQVPMSGTK